MPARPPKLVDDLEYVNADADGRFAKCVAVAPDLEARVEREWRAACRHGDDFVLVPMPRVAGLGDRAVAAARSAWQQEKAIVDARLQRRVTVAAKGIAFVDLCRRWSDETGIEFHASRIVADDKLTLFCTNEPLRDIMRQITGVFGFGWARDGEQGAYRYTLTQDLRSQFEEEELRNKDRDEALLALDKQMERYRKFLDLTPDQAAAMRSGASPEDAEALEALSGAGWAAAHLYFQLGPSDFSAMQAGGSLEFGDGTGPALTQGQQSAILGSMGDMRISTGPNGMGIGPASTFPNGTPPAATQGAQATASLYMDHSELGEFVLNGSAGVSYTHGGSKVATSTSQSLARGVSPSVANPDNAKANSDFAHDPDLAKPTDVEPMSSVRNREANSTPTEPKVTTVDILEAFHNATGKPVVGDFFTRLFSPASVTVRGKPMFAALNQVCDSIHVRWSRKDGWLRFRTTSYFNDRLKEVPNRLLERWAAARRQRGYLSPQELIEIAQLTNVQLLSPSIKDGAQYRYGLDDWGEVADGNLLEHWRFLASLPRDLADQAMSDRGLGFSQLPVNLQEEYVRLALISDDAKRKGRLEDMAAATLQVAFTPPKRPSDTTRSARSDTPRPGATFTYVFGGVNIPLVRYSLSAGQSSSSVIRSASAGR